MRERTRLHCAGGEYAAGINGKLVMVPRAPGVVLCHNVEILHVYQRARRCRGGNDPYCTAGSGTVPLLYNEHANSERCMPQSRVHDRNGATAGGLPGQL
jgi:hypothetical protein